MRKYSILGGKKLYAEDFAYVPDPAKPSTWKLRIDDAGHVRDAMARWNQTEGIPEEKKAGVLRKLMAQARKFGIDTANFEKEHKLGAVVRAFFQLAALAERDGLVRIPVIKVGRYVYGGRKLNITAETVAQMVRNFSARPVEVPLSYEHTVEHPEDAGGKPIPAAGWLKELEAKPDPNGILWGWAQFTAETAKLVQNDQYKYISPAFAMNYANHQTGKDQGATLLSVALTNRPFLDMPPITMSVVLPAADETEINPAQGNKEQQSMAKPTMKKVSVSPITDGDQKGHLLIQHEDIPETKDDKPQQFYADSDEVQKALSAVPDDDDDEDGDEGDDEGDEGNQGDDDDDDDEDGVTASAVRKGARKIALLSGVKGAKTLTPAVVKAIAVKVGMAAGKAQVVTLTAVPKDGKGRREYHRLNVPEGAVVEGSVFRAFVADFELDAAVRDGKILPAQRAKFERIAHKDIEIFRAMVEAMPKAVDFSVAGAGHAGGGNEVQLTAEEAAIAKQMGNDPAKVLEAKKLALARPQGE